MKLWSFYGLRKFYTQPLKNLKKKISFEIKPLKKDFFKKSIHVFPIDAGNDNQLNFEIFSLQSPKYNLHRFGIFFTNTPRHADILIILGRPTEKMLLVVKEAINQMPEPFGVILIENNEFGIDFKRLEIPNVLAHLKGEVEAIDILNVLLEVMGREK